MGLVKWIVIVVVLLLAIIGAMTLFGQDSDVTEDTEEFDENQVDTSDIEAESGEDLILDSDLGDEENEVDIGEVI